jgi:hypothetical protein
MKLNLYSQQILEHIKKIPKIKNKIKFSNNSKKLLTSLFKNIKHGEDQFNKIDLYKIKCSDYKSNNLYDSIPFEIKELIHNNEITQLSYSFIIGNRSINVHFIIPSNNKRAIDEINTSLKLIYNWFYVADKYSTNTNCANKLDLYLFFINHYKVLPYHKGEPIEQKHANTAYTWACVKESTILIFREEEWFKVLIHETFHCFGLDFSTMDVSKCEKKIREWFSIQTEGLLYESYCETWACIINSLFIAFYSSKDKKNSIFLKNVENLLLLETKYSIFQTIKVLDHYGLSYFDLINKTIHTIKQRENYREKTNVFCYNVIKSLMLYNLDDFLNWCYINNSESIEFPNTTSAIEKLCLWIERIYKKSDYLEDYKIIEKHFMETPKKRIYVYQSMRMTIFG